MTQESFGRNLLMKQFKELTKSPVEGFSVGLHDDDIYKWKVLLEGPEDTPYEGGFFQCSLIFPKSYPNSPPDFYFPHYFWHPNVYKQNDALHGSSSYGCKTCISILHEAVEDPMNEMEQLSEKWRPILGVESILLSIQSLLAHPNLDSPANIDAAVQLRNDPDVYNKKIRNLVRKSLDYL